MHKKMVVLVVLLALQALLVPAVGGAVLSHHWKNVIVPGVSLAGVSLGGLDGQQSRALLSKSIPPPDTIELILAAGSARWKISGRDIKLEYKIDSVINEAYKIGHTGSAPRRITETVSAGVRSNSILLEYSFDRKALSKKLEDINRQYATLPQNAKLLWQDGKISRVGPQYGREIDIEATLEKLESQSFIPGRAVPVVVKRIKPPVTEEELSGIEESLGSFSTKFDPMQEERSHNIKLAGEAVNNTIVRPGEELSFNAVLGGTGGEKGYKKAPVIMGNKLTKDYGGGVCQVSTTLYNAVLLAGVEVLERHSHTIPVDYVRPGLDATVALGEKDFRIRNNKKYPLYISCKVSLEEGNLEIRILGKDKKKQSVRVEPEVDVIPPKVMVTSNPRMARGEISIKSEGRQGYRVEVYRVTGHKNEEEKELISKNYYPPEPRLVEVGPPGGLVK